MCIYNVYHVLVLRQFNMLIVQAGDDNCVGNECSDVEAELMRQGGRLIVRESDSTGRN